MYTFYLEFFERIHKVRVATFITGYFLEMQ
jgi:hypothetical protein